MDIKLLNIEATSGLDKETIRENYDALIDYSSPFFRGDLRFPSLAASENGLTHFAEVKDIFTAFYIIAAITLVLGIVIIIYKAKNRDYSYLLTSAVTAIVLPLLLALYMAVDFDRAFVIFHKIFFRNDYWLFDPATDPVITILPDTFFMHSAIMIIVIVLLFCLTFILFYIRTKRHTGIKYRKIKALKI
jgi:integral membrane protein (TIGR01906 family)